MSRSLTTTAQKEHRLKTVEIPATIKLFMTNNPNTQHCNYAVSKDCINSVSTDTNIESTHFPIYLQIKENYFKVQLEKSLYLPVSYHEIHTKAQPNDQIHHHRIQRFKNNLHPRKLPDHTTY